MKFLNINLQQMQIDLSLYTMKGSYLYSIVLFIFLFISVFIPGSVLAQSTLTGGSYTLNGGVTVFSGEEMNGGEYSLAPSGDPLTGSGTGGSFVLAPTPYYTVSNPESPTTPTPDNMVAGNSSGGAGYAYPLYKVPASSPNQNPIQYGMEWIDDGTGVDVNQDGIPDIYAQYSGNNSSQGNNSSMGSGVNRPNSPSKTYQNSDELLVKKYSNSLSQIQIIFIIIYTLLYFIVPIVRGPFPYRVSRFLPAVIIDWIIAVHKDTPLKNVPFHSKTLEAEELKNGQHLHYFILFLLDTLALPIILVLGVIYLWAISPILSLILLGLLGLRLYIGELLTREHK